MTYRFTLLIPLFFFSPYLLAQPGNLVPNPGFEERSDCLWNNGFIHHAPPWFRPTKGTPDVFHECGIVNPAPCPYPEIVALDQWHFGVPTNVLGCQDPFEGLGYAGTALIAPGFPPDEVEWREYLSVELIEPMVEGETYDVSMVVSLAERSGRAVWAVQVAFLHELDTNYSSANHLPILPSLTHTEGEFITSKDDWTSLSWQYTAVGGERYMYIGNFQSNLEIDTLDILPAGEISMAYFVHTSYYFFDNIYVGNTALKTWQQNLDKFQLWPNPAAEWIKIDALNGDSYEIMDMLGGVMQTGFVDSEAPFVIDIRTLPTGIYLLRLMGGDLKMNYRLKKFVKR